MFCPSCGYQNLATTVRCIQCGKTLIDRPEDHSPELKKAGRMIDAGMYGGIGSMVGFFVALVTLKFLLADLHLSDPQVYGGALGGAIAGRIIGRLVLKWR